MFVVDIFTVSARTITRPAEFVEFFSVSSTHFFLSRSVLFYFWFIFFAPFVVHHCANVETLI